MGRTKQLFAELMEKELHSAYYFQNENILFSTLGNETDCDNSPSTIDSKGLMSYK